MTDARGPTISIEEQIEACEKVSARLPNHAMGNRLRAQLRAAAATLRDAEPLVREIHEQLKRGHDTVDHGLIGNLRCIVDTLADDIQP